MKMRASGNTWQQKALKRVAQLVSDLKHAEDFWRAKEALLEFIQDLDGDSDDGLGALGDGDFASLFFDSLERSGKIPVEKSALELLRKEQAFRSAAKKRMRRASTCNGG